MKLDSNEKHALLFRTLLALLMIAVAAAVRIGMEYRFAGKN